MKRIILAAGTAAVVFLGVGCAGTKEATKDVGAAVPGFSQKGTGVVQEVRENEFSVVGLNGSPEKVWFSVSPKTEVMKDQQRIEVSQIKQGDAVKIAYESSAGAERAYKVDVLTAGDAAKVKGDLEAKGVGGAGLEGTKNP